MFASAFRSPFRSPSRFSGLDRSPIRLTRRTRSLLVALLLAAAFFDVRAYAADEALLDLPMLQQLETRAAQSAPRDQAFLYTEVLHGLTELAGRQMSAGDDDNAVATLKVADVVAVRLHEAELRDARRLKNAELLLEHTTRRLSDMVRVASTEQRDTMQSVLKHFNSVHDDVLAALFSK